MDILDSQWYAAVGATLLACLASYFTWRNGYKTRSATAAAKFRSSVLAALSGLYPMPTEWPDNKYRIEEVLKGRFPALQVAVAEFEPYVPRRRQAAFKAAWRKYRLGDDGRDIDQQYYMQYVPIKGTVVTSDVEREYDNSKTYKAAFLANVENLLSFASET